MAIQAGGLDALPGASRLNHCSPTFQTEASRTERR